MTNERVSFFLTVLFILFCMPVPIKAESENIINGGFETGNLAPWDYLGLAPDPPPNIITNTYKYSGSYSLEMGGYTARIVEQKFLRSVIPTGTLSFKIYVPEDIYPCDNIITYCYPSFGVSIKYEDFTDNQNKVGELTGGPGWKQIDIAVDISKKIKAVTFTTAEINPLYIDEVSLLGLSSFPWTIYLPAFMKKKE